MSEHIQKSHNKSLLLYHFVCSIKYRWKVFSSEVSSTFKDICLKIEERYEIPKLGIVNPRKYNPPFRLPQAGGRATVPTAIRFQGNNGTILVMRDASTNRTLNAIIKTLVDYPQMSLFMCVNRMANDDPISRKGFDNKRRIKIISERASAITKFLSSQGIDENRIKWDYDNTNIFSSKKDRSGVDKQNLEIRNNGD